jgi:hypothetical protein
MKMSRTVRPNVVTYVKRSFLLSAAAVVFVLIVITVAFAFGSSAIAVGVAGGLLYFVLMLVGSFKMRAQLKRRLQGDGEEHP